MLAGLKKYGFAAAVVGVMALGAGAVVVRSVADGEQAQGGPGGRPGGGAAAEVGVETIGESQIFDAVRAIGTARARESIVVSSKVTDVISAIRFESGDRVRAGQVLVELANVEQQADLAEARASLDVEEREYERFRELGERGFAPAARVEEARAAYERAQARVSALESRIADRTIRAPFAGIMGLRTASPGALARPGEPIATLDDVSTIKLDFDVAETHMARMRPGAEIEASTPAFPGVVFAGRIDDVDSRIDPQTRTLRVRAVLPNGDGRLKPGMLMSVQVKANPRTALTAPEVGVLERIDGSYVLKVESGDGGDRAALVKIETGERSDGRVEILSGLQAGDRIVVDGVQRVRPGQAVAPVLKSVADPAAPAPSPAPART